MGKIHLLSQNLINLIAAGEVVERPASALKELIENSIDAGSTEIIVSIEDYGNKLIQVKDNGIGMNKDDAYMALRQHATSKIQSEVDLHKILTLGFRGEALASITSIAGEIILETKAEDNEPVKLVIHQADIIEAPSTTTEKGTTISIHNIFNNIPARKKFLKSPQTELKYITNTFLDVALVNTDIHFELYHNSKLLQRLTRTNNIKDRIFEIWGANIAKNLYDKVDMESSLGKIEIILGNPEIARKSSALQYTYVNDRFTMSKVIASAVQTAFTGFIHRDLKPVYFILIHIDPSKVDVNIHPRKLEVKFENSEELFKMIFGAIKKILENKTKQIIVEKLANETYTKPKIPSANTYTQSHSFPGFVQDKAKEPPSYKPPKFKVEEALSFTKALLSPTEDSNDKTDNSLQFSKIAIDNPQQVFNTYIIVEGNNELIFIDQHAAAEKALFEKLISELDKVERKPFLLPEIIDLTLTDKEIVLNKKNELEEIGVIIDDFGKNSIQVLEIPLALKQLDTKHYIEKILNPDTELYSTFDTFQTFNNIKLTKELYLLIATTACHGSIRAGQKLTAEEMRSIIISLTKLHNPYNCPHGRPTMWTLGKYEIEKNFRRKI